MNALYLISPTSHEKRATDLGRVLQKEEKHERPVSFYKTKFVLGGTKWEGVVLLSFEDSAAHVTNKF